MSIVTDLFIYNDSKEMFSPLFFELIENKGIKGDRFFGESTKQVAIADKNIYESIKRSEHPRLCFERFKANILLDHFDADSYPINSIIKCDTSVLEVSAHKTCLADCKLAQSNKPCPLKKAIVFAKVIKSGIIHIDSKLS